MVQFEAGQSRTARVRMKNPTGKAFDYTGSILFSLSPVSEKSFSLGAGEERDILFPVTIPDMIGTHPVYVSVSSQGKAVALYRATEDVEVIAPSLTLSFTGPRAGAILWDALIWDIGTKGKLSGLPAGSVPLDAGKTFKPSSATFLLYVMELPPYPSPGPYWYGPYLVQLPRLGRYTWDSKNARIDSIGAKDLPFTTNESLITGTVQALSWAGEEAPSVWSASILVEDAAGVSGCENVGQYFSGTVIPVYGAIPVDSVGQPVVKVGDRVQVRLRLGWATYSAYWWTWEYRRYYALPPAAFSFSGSVVVGGLVGGKRQVSWSVSGGMPPFAVRVLRMGPYGVLGVAYRGTGPACGVVEIDEADYTYGYELLPQVFAHPDPDAPEWGQYSWQYDNWRRVA